MQRQPRLRFPGFEGEWTEEILGQISSVNQTSRSVPDEFIYIDLESVEKGQLKQINTIKRDHAPSRAQRVLEKQDILFQTVRPYQQNNLFFNFDGKYVASTGYAHIRAKQDPRFLYQYLHTNKFLNDVLIRCTGSGYPAINSNDLKNISVNLPSVHEQQKIASFLSSIDDWISNLRQQNESLKEYKKGITQRIFIQEIRFKDDKGMDFPVWEEKKLGDIFTKNKNRNADSREKKVLTNSAIEGIVNQQDYFDKDIANQNNLTNYYVVDIDDFIYNPRISKSAPVGPLKRNKLKKGIMSPLYTVLKPKEGNLIFFEKYFETKYWHKYMYKIANYGARHDRMNILQGDFMKMPVPFPSLPEQQKIADFLSSISRAIKLKEQQIAEVEKWKKGLTQNLFI